MLRVGLTGGIACGKSRVLSRLASRGVPSLDLDHVAHEIIEPGTRGHAEIVTAFGRAVLSFDGRIDRKILGSMVFRDAAARARLNAIVHPLVRAEESHRAAGYARSGARILVSDAALLVESGTHLRYDRVVVVHCRPEQQLERLIRRNSIDEAAARDRVAAQMQLGEKRLFGHLEVDTSGAPDDTDAGADALAHRLVALADASQLAPRPSRSGCLGAVFRGPRNGPRGLSIEAVAGAIHREHGLEMASLAESLVPPAPGAWYDTALGDAAEPWTLVAPLVVWAAVRPHCDLEYLAGAAATLARLTHPRGSSNAAACLVALWLWRVLTRLPLTPDWRRVAREASERWGGGQVPAWVDTTLEAFGSAAADPGSVTSRVRELGGNPELASLMAGAAIGASEAEVGTALARVVGQLLSPKEEPAGPC